jgi:RNA polymerase sigma factor (sigma-70 family)
LPIAFGWRLITHRAWRTATSASITETVSGEQIADSAFRAVPALAGELSAIFCELVGEIGEDRVMERRSDADLMAASLDDPTVFGEIFDRHANTLLRFLVRRCEREVGEGLLGELFRIAFERREIFDVTRESARPWLYGIATNLLLKHRRSEARRMKATARLAASEPPSRDEIEEEFDLRSLLPRVAVAIEALPIAERQALLLFAWEELSYQDIAVALDVPVGTVRSRLNRARRRLRELCEPSGKERVERDGSHSGRATR